MTPDTPKILVVDDEEWVVRLVRAYLTQSGFAVEVAHDGPGALKRLERELPALVILDLMLPGVDGMEIARRLRKRSDVPIIMLTARTEEPDRVAGLEVGADDYVVKPFSARELVSRVQAVLRRTLPRSELSEQLHAGLLRLVVARRQAWHGEAPIELTAMEFDLLAYLMQHPGRVFTRLQLLDALRGSTYASFERSIDALIKRLRHKIEPDPKAPRYVLTVFSVGYKFADGGPP